MRAMIPFVHLVRDVFCVEAATEVAVIFEKRVFLTDHEHNIHLTKILKPVVAMEVL